MFPTPFCESEIIIWQLFLQDFFSFPLILRKSNKSLSKTLFSSFFSLFDKYCYFYHWKSLNSPYNGVLFLLLLFKLLGACRKKVFWNLWYQGVQRNYQWLQDTRGVLETMVLVLQNAVNEYWHKLKTEWYGGNFVWLTGGVFSLLRRT